MPGLPFQLPSGLPTTISADDTGLAGESSGVATVIGLLVQHHELAGTSNGTSSVSSRLTTRVKISGTSVGTATISGNLEVGTFADLAGTITGTSIVTGVIAHPGPEVFATPGQFTFTVPEHVNEIKMKVWGAGAGGGGGAAVAIGGDGGGGGFAASLFAVTPGETLDVFVGGGGEGGFGDGSVWNGMDGGGGGGYSGIKRSSSNLIISGSGGGGGGARIGSVGLNGGGGGGDVGVSGSGSGGGGGSQVAGGVGGGSGAQDGSLLQGGDGASDGTPTTAGGVNGGGRGGHGWPYITRIGAGGGGGAGRYGGGGGGQHGGGGGGSNHLTGAMISNERANTWIGAGKLDEDHPGGNYGNGGVGVSHATGDAGEGGYVHLSWQMNIASRLNANVILGSSSVQGTLDPLNPGILPVPIPVDLLVEAGAIHDLGAVSAGQAAVIGVLKLFRDPAASPSGVATVTGSLTNTEMELAGTSSGSTTISAVLQNGPSGVFPIELAGQSNGSATIKTVHSVLTGSAIEQRRSLYQIINVGAAFDPTDVYNGPASVVTHRYPDGNVQTDFKRFLMQLVNVGAAFDDTDDINTRTVGSINPKVTAVISQPFPDGNIRDDWGRNLYQFLQVIEEKVQTGRLRIGPAPSRDTWRPFTKPPTSDVRSSGPVSTGPRA